MQASLKIYVLMPLFLTAKIGFCDQSKQVTDKKIRQDYAVRIFKDVQQHFLGLPGTCKPRDELEPSKDIVQAMKSYEPSDIIEVSFLDQYGISFILESKKKLPPLALDVWLNNGSCKNFDVSRFYSDPV